MKTQKSDGRLISVPADADYVSGDFVQIGELQGVAVADAATGETVVIDTEGVYALPKEATTDTFDVGDPVQWATDEIEAYATGGQRIGVVVKAAIATDATADVKLLPGAVDAIA